jgi:hypothetical protein
MRTIMVAMVLDSWEVLVELLVRPVIQKYGVEAEVEELAEAMGPQLLLITQGMEVVMELEVEEVRRFPNCRETWEVMEVKVQMVP